MSQNKREDVIIIGGGVVGCAAALELARRGVRVRLAERARLGQEASWAGAGILSPGNYHRTGVMSLLSRASLKRYPAWTEQLREETGVDPQYKRCGRLALCFEDQQQRMAASQCRVTEGEVGPDGRPVLEMLTPEQTREAEPALTEDLLASMRCGVTAQVRNPRLLRSLRVACLQRGVDIREGVPVHGLLWEGDRVVGVRAGGETWQAGTTIVAGGAWSAQIDERIAPAIPVYPVRGQILLLEMLPRPFSHVIERGKCYLVCRQDGKIVIGATEEHESGFNTRTTAEGIAGLFNLATRMMPALAKAHVVQTWAGLRPGTPDRKPFIGPLDGVDGLLLSTGHFRSGLALAPLNSEILADLICEGRTEHDLSACRPGRSFTKTTDADAAKSEE